MQPDYEIRTKEDALRWFHEIPYGIARNDMRSVYEGGRIGRKDGQVWNDPTFTLGMEYGAMYALIKVFGITAEDLARPAPASTSPAAR